MDNPWFRYVCNVGFAQASKALSGSAYTGPPVLACVAEGYLHETAPADVMRRRAECRGRVLAGSAGVVDVVYGVRDTGACAGAKTEPTRVLLKGE
jgi:hypothetical protein